MYVKYPLHSLTSIHNPYQFVQIQETKKYKLTVIRIIIIINAYITYFTTIIEIQQIPQPISSLFMDTTQAFKYSSMEELQIYIFMIFQT